MTADNNSTENIDSSSKSDDDGDYFDRMDVDENNEGTIVAADDDDNDNDNGSHIQLNYHDDKSVSATIQPNENNDDDDNNSSNNNAKSKKKIPSKEQRTPTQPPNLQKKKKSFIPKKPKKSSKDEELIRLALHRNPYFTCLDEEQIERFIEEAELVTDFRPGQAVIVEGPPTTGPTTQHQHKPKRARTVGDEYDEYFDADDDSGPADIDDLWLNDNTTTTTTSKMVNDAEDTDDNASERNNNNPHSSLDVESNNNKNDKKSYLYMIRNGHADVFYETVNPATLGRPNFFGEGGFLFGRNHSASVVAATDKLECFRIDRHTFIHKILPSHNMKRMYRKYASSTATTTDEATASKSSKPNSTAATPIPVANSRENKEDSVDIDMDSNEIETIIDNNVNTGAMDDNGEEIFFMTMDDFLQFFKKERRREGGSSGISDDLDDATASPSTNALSSIANAYQSILRGSSTSTYHDERNWITLEDFCFFHFLMARPDPEIDIAFILMDRSRTGTITRSDFESYIRTSVPYFDQSNSEFIERHFGYGRVIRTHQFSQFLQDLQRELGRQAFLFRVNELAKESSSSSSSSGSGNSLADPHIGYLPAETFIDVLTTTSSWRLPYGVIDRLESLYCKPSIDSAESTALASVRAGTIKGDSPKKVAEYSRRSVLADLERRRNKLGTRHFAYVDYIAFQDLLVQLPAICNLIERSCEIKKGPVSPDDVKVANRVLGIGGRLSRQQVDIIFDLFDLDHDGYLSSEDAISVCGLEIGSNVLEAVEGRYGMSTFAPPPNYPESLASTNEGFGYNRTKDDGRQGNMSLEEWMITQATQFLLSSFAGGFAIFSFFPFDLVKTRMMNQRFSAGHEARLYHSSFECFQTLFRYEGFQGLYRGLLPPLLAAGPEKFVKFTVNDLLRGVLSNKEDGLSFQWLTEIVSGGCAGACQLLVTNPLEIVKIRMQMQGETARIYQEKGFNVPKGLGLHRMSFSQIVADLGASGLYKGAAACLMRDIPFGAIYFPAYAACMDYLVNRDGSTGASSGNILMSGTLAAIPASLLTNPMDLVKTRLQVASRPGEEIYTGIGDCIRKVYQNEGPAAFFKGCFPRVCRIAPQFGISLFAYEKLSQLIGFKGIAPPTNAPVNPHDYRAAFSSVSSRIEMKALDAENLIETIGLFKPPRP
jgi:solute carrier family 25 aspartate/glutamate transporter 12/13